MIRYLYANDESFRARVDADSTLELLKKKYREDPDFRERCKAYANLRYLRDEDFRKRARENSNTYHRKRYAEDEEYRERIRSRSRASAAKRREEKK